MLIGHLPAGYFLTRWLIKKNRLPISKLWLGLGLLGSVLPDFDIIYPILFKNSIGSHRYFFTYIPLFWLVLVLIGWLFYKIYKKSWLKYSTIIIFANVFLHLFLDTAFVGVRWLWPFYDGLIGVYNVGFTGGFLVDNYFHHWYWYLEIVIWLLAIVSVVISYKKGEIK
ncbi:MAG: metal-dependent hydrolase [Patescibacteria group bacterium]|jgi:inner membrane protein